MTFLDKDAYLGYAAKIFDYFISEGRLNPGMTVTFGPWTVTTDESMFVRVAHRTGSFRVQCEDVPLPMFAADNDRVFFVGNPDMGLVKGFVDYLKEAHPEILA